ncbi:unnamed protein product [Ambrosiozyma monospora]|uniref:Unnamed protein product n=1 Tax=Ambrosiozyma monospora TaxID=43982 RepID=A0ACB5ST04_AMBMO|nr:unnamed protein product [Ambrosiozyma monospora]
MILMADEKDADTFHKLISEFESISNLRLNLSKSIAYGTVGAHNKVIKNWDIPIKKNTDDLFTYLGGLVYLIYLNRLVIGRKAQYILATLKATSIPSILNIRRLIQNAIDIQFKGLTWYHFFLHFDFGNQNSNELRTIIINSLSDRSPQTASLISSWFELTARSEHHPSVTAPVVHYTITSMAPETEILPYVQHQHTGEPLTTTTTFNSNSKKFYAAQWESHIITPSKAANKDKDMWKDYWSRFSNFVNKHPGSFEYYHQLNNYCKKICCYCNNNNHYNTNDHLRDECKVTQQKWKIIRGGTTLRLNSNFSPSNISRKALIGNIMPVSSQIQYLYRNFT